MTPFQDAYTTEEVARITGATPRQLQWWDETRRVSPLHMKHKRIYEPRELFAVALLHDLQERGFRRSQAVAIWEEAQRRGFTLPDPSSRWMLTDGKRVLFIADAATAFAFLEQRRPGFVLVPLEAIQTRLLVDAARLVKRGPGLATAGETRTPQLREARQA